MKDVADGHRGSDGAVPRVLFVSHTAEWTGPTHSLLLLLKYLRTRLDCKILLPGTGLFAERLEAESIPYFSLPTLRASQIPAMMRLIRRDAIDLVYGNNTSAGSKNALVAAKLQGVPFVYHVRGMGDTGGWRRTGFIRFADATIVVSHAVARSFSRFLHGRAPHVVHNGVPQFAWSTSRGSARKVLLDSLELPEDSVIILSIGNVDARKAPEYAIRAMSRVAEQVPYAVLLVVGRLDRDPQYAERVRELIEKLGLVEQVRLLGFRTDVIDLLQAADLFVHTAVRDPHPRSVLEAMAAGLPVVAFSVDGVAETVVDGGTGYLVKAHDADGLSSAIVQVLGDPDRRAVLGANGRVRVVKEFSAETTARKVGDIIEFVLRRRSLEPGNRHGAGE